MANQQLPFLNDLNEIVFENRNKAYGAYVLRKEYNAKLRNAFFIVAGASVLLAAISYGIAKLKDYKPETVETTVDFSQEDVPPPPEDKNEPTPPPPPPPPPPATPPPPPPPPVATVDAREMVATTIDKLPDIKINTDLEKGQASDKDQEGVQTPAFIPPPPVTEPGGTGITTPPPPPPVVEQPKVEEIIEYAEEMPMFPGSSSKDDSDSKFLDYARKSIKYPPALVSAGVQGRVQVSFVVAPDGSITDVRLVKGKHPQLDAEAIRVIKAMPRWTGGKQNGQPVKVRMPLPVTFKIN